MRRYLVILLLIVFTRSLTGCSFFGRFYIVNKSGKPAHVAIKFSSHIEIDKVSESGLALRYADTVIQVNDKADALLIKQLEYKQPGQQTVSFEVPPNSTVFVGGAYNRPVYADSLHFIINGISRVYSLQSISKHLKRTGGMFPPFHYTYIIEDGN